VKPTVTLPAARYWVALSTGNSRIRRFCLDTSGVGDDNCRVTPRAEKAKQVKSSQGTVRRDGYRSESEYKVIQAKPATGGREEARDLKVKVTTLKMRRHGECDYEH